jgi:hypothetical protein
MLNLTAVKNRSGRVQAARPDRISHSQEVREAECLGLIKDQGGISINSHALRLDHLAYIKKYKPDVKAGVVDRLTMTRTLQSMARRGLIKMSYVTVTGFAESAHRHEVVYLISIDFEGEEMKAFLARLQFSALVPPTAPSWTMKRRKVETFVERKRAVTSGQVQQGGMPDAEDAVVRDFFTCQWRIVAQYYGYVYGRMARASILHRAMVEAWLQLGNVPSKTALPSDLLFTHLTLDCYLRVVATTSLDVELDAFLQRDGARQLPLSQVPESIRTTLGVGKSKSREKLALMLDILTTLRLVQPLVVKDAGELGPAEAAPPTHWRLHTRLPVYHLAAASKRKPLIAVVDLVDADSCAAYWQQLRHACSAGVQPTTIDAPDDIEDILKTEGRFTRDATAKTKWVDSFTLLADQREWLAKQVQEEPEPADNDALVKRLAHVVIAPPDTVVKYLRELHGKPAPRRYRRKSNRTRDDPSEAEGETETEGAVPLPKLSAREAKERARTQLAARAADAQQQREADWDALVRKYESRANGRKLDADVAESLKGWFLLSGADRMNAKQVEEQLDKYLSYGTKPPQIVHPRPKLIRNVTPVVASRRTTSTAPVHTAPPPPANREIGKVVESALRTDRRHFLRSPGCAAEPQLAGTQRQRWTRESDELLRDAYAVASGRAGELGVARSWEPVAQVFPHRNVSQIRQHARVLFSRPAETSYVRALEEAWLAVWHRDRGTALHDPYPTSLTNFDMSSHVGHLRREIDKSALCVFIFPRLADPLTRLDRRRADFFAGTNEEIDLPDHTAAIEARWKLIRNDQVTRDFKSAVNTYWNGSGGTQKDRLISLNTIAFGAPCEPLPPVEGATTHSAEVVKALCAYKVRM